ncbi:MAG: hypothetical protein ACM3O7_05450 [Acidobacteriota bacterium]
MARMSAWRVWLVAAAVAWGVAVMAPGSAAGAPGGPVDELVRRLMAAGSIGQAEQALRAARLPPGDAAALRARLKEPAVAAHLRRLAGQAASLARSQAAQSAKLLAERLNAKNGDALAARNRQVQGRLAVLLSGKAKPLPTVRMTPVAPQTLLAARSFRPTEDNPATITSASPDPAVVGQLVTFSGRRFGGDRGRVDLLFEAARLSIACEVRGWSDSGVSARVPAGVEALVGSSGESVLFWVRAPSHDLGPTFAMRLVSSGVPTITGTSDTSIEPGQLLIVEGTGFGAGRGQARVRFPSLGHTQDALVDSWADTAVVVHLDEGLSGLPREVACELELTTAGGRSARHRLTFHATIVYHTLSEVLVHEDSSCDWVYWTDNPFFRETLRNDWQVYSQEVHLESDPHLSSCEITDRPPAGGDRPMMAVRTGVDGGEYCYYVSVRCTAYVTIAGPRGTWYHGGSIVPPT